MSQPKGTALVVDDFDDGRALLTYVLTTAGYHVIEAANGTETLARMDDAPDLVILDVHLPDIDGFEVCRRIKADVRNALTPVVMVSAVFSRTEHCVRGLSGGADAYLPKPFEPELLVATAEALMRHRLGERELAHRNRLLRMENELTRMLAEPACIEDDPTGFLHATAEALDADLAEFWRVEPGDGVLVRAGAWYGTEIDGTSLDRASEEVRLGHGIGGAGWREALSTQLARSRAAAAEALGLRSATVVPLFARETITGALVLFHRRARKPEEDSRQLLAEVRNCIWHFLERPGAAQAFGLAKDEPSDGSKTVANRVTPSVVHALRNLLFVIGARAELLMEALPAEIPRRRDLDTIMDATKRAAELLQRPRGGEPAGRPPAA
jgi:CheY-like chemotaxis protein